MINSVLFFGRTDCKYSSKIKSFLKKKIKRVDVIISGDEEKIDKKKILNKKYDFIFCFRSKFFLKKGLI